MKAKIFYQDMELNVNRFMAKPLVIGKKTATEVAELEFDIEDRWCFCDKAYREMNITPWLSSAEFRAKIGQLPFESKHTSMSIGDYVQFDDGEIYICDLSGWYRVTSENKHSVDWR